MIEEALLYDLLYVEDEKEVRKNYIEYLGRFFNHIYEASTAEEAYKIYEKKRPSILVVDINLPGMSGIEFMQKIRKNDHTTKAIMLTANSDVETLLSATELKLTKYLVKPVSREDLKNALHLVLEEIRDYTTIPNKIIKLKESFYWDQENKKLLRETRECSLSKKEIELLSLLCSNVNRIFSVDDIVFELWYDAEESKNDALKTLIKNLRKKLPKDTIKNVFGFGYKITL